MDRLLNQVKKRQEKRQIKWDYICQNDTLKNIDFSRLNTKD